MSKSIIVSVVEALSKEMGFIAKNVKVVDGLSGYCRIVSFFVDGKRVSAVCGLDSNRMVIRHELIRNINAS